MFVKKESVLPSLNAIISSSAGFFAGVYMPLGFLSGGASKLLKFTPALYDASMLRNILMKSQLEESFHDVNGQVLEDFKATMGLKINGLANSMGSMLVCGLFIGMFFVVFVLLTRLSKKTK